MKITGNLTAFSKGLYSNWFYHKPTRSLFDCGEGVATTFGNFLYGIENIFISHSHGDHVLGLPSLIGCRNSGRGDKEKPLNIYYPADNQYAMLDLINFISRRNPRLNFDINWNAISTNDTFVVGDRLSIKPFKMSHQKGKTTLGYNVVEKRSRLKAGFVGKNIPELLKSGVDKKDLNEEYHKKLLSYCLDSYYLDVTDIAETEVAVMDCTFVDDNDRDDSTHFSFSEATALCKEAKVESMIAAHFSGRYHSNQITQMQNRLQKDVTFGIDVVIPGEVYTQ
jgi:ribonuclease Z